MRGLAPRRRGVKTRAGGAALLVLAAILVGPARGEAAFTFPPTLTTDSDKGTWIMQEADRIGVGAIAAMRQRPVPQEALRQARASLQQLLDPCVKLGRRSCSDGLTFINYYTEQIDSALKGNRGSRTVDEDGAYRRAVDAKRLPAWEHEMMLARRPWVGMSEDLLRLAWGPPDRVSRMVRSLGTAQQWSYAAVGSTVTLLDGSVTSITQVGQAP